MNLNNGLVAGSIFMHRVELIRKLSASVLSHMENILELSFGYSVIRANVLKLWTPFSNSVKRAVPGAALTRSMICVVAAMLYRIREWLFRVSYNIYSGSLFLGAVGRAAENSRCVR